MAIGAAVISGAAMVISVRGPRMIIATVRVRALVVIFSVLVAAIFARLVGIGRWAGMDVVAVSATEPGPLFEFWCSGCRWHWLWRWCQRRRQRGSGTRGWGSGRRG